MNSTMANNVGALWLKIAVVYVLIGMLLGLYMGATEQMQYIPVHAHLNLLGWVTLALAGIVYQIFPRMAASPCSAGTSGCTTSACRYPWCSWPWRSITGRH